MSVTDATLQGIPPEIRLIIYSYLLPSDNSIVIYPGPTESLAELYTIVSENLINNEDLHPAIISCCLLFSREATDVFYGINVFEVELSSWVDNVLPHFLSKIGQLNGSKLQSFTITMMNSNPETPECSLAHPVQKFATIVLRLTRQHHKLRVLRLQLKPDLWEPIAVDRCRDWGLLVQRQLLDGLHEIRSENGGLISGKISLGSLTPETCYDTLELATLTWEQAQNGMSLTTSAGFR